MNAPDTPFPFDAALAAAADRLEPKVIAWRRDLHRNPELGNREVRTAGIVAAHVRDGLALAERYHLPAVIREMIPGHHGNSVVKYFFQLAQQCNLGGDIVIKTIVQTSQVIENQLLERCL